MRFWDTSALVPLFVDEAATGDARRVLAEDHTVIVWSSTLVELMSALARLRRESQGAEDLLLLARREVRQRWADWTPVTDLAGVAVRAQRLVDVHPLKTLDALQLAAALVAAGDHPQALPFVTRDRQLATSAELEGFHVIVPSLVPPGPQASTGSAGLS